MRQARPGPRNSGATHEAGVHLLPHSSQSGREIVESGGHQRTSRYALTRKFVLVRANFLGAPGRIRTCDARFRKPMLYPLSYEGRRRRPPRVACQPNWTSRGRLSRPNTVAVRSGSSAWTAVGPGPRLASDLGSGLALRVVMAEATSEDGRGDGPKLFAGGNPPIPKGDGPAAVGTYLDVLPGWKGEGGAGVGHRRSLRPVARRIGCSTAARMAASVATRVTPRRARVTAV